MNKVYKIITDKIIEQLEKNIIPWRKTWASPLHFPANYITNKCYSGVNVFLLGTSSYTSRYWLTYNQAKLRGGNVIKGQKGTTIIFWKLSKKEDKTTGKETSSAMLRYYNVFNLEQCENVSELPNREDTQVIETGSKPIEELENFVADLKDIPKIVHIKNSAYYDTLKDVINMPLLKNFDKAELYYSTLFHEIIHSTGHDKRLKRDMEGNTVTTKTAKRSYAKEELIAEIGACFLNSFAGIENIELDNSVSYIKGWLRVLKSDPCFIVSASGKAQKAVDYLIS